MLVLQRISVTLFLITILAGCASLPEEIEHPTGLAEDRIKSE